MFKVGDVVRITQKFAKTPKLYFADRMVHHVGKIGKVVSVEVDTGHIRVDVAGGLWYWLPKCIEHVNMIHVGDVVRSKNQNKKILKVVKCFDNDKHDPHYKGIDAEGFYINFRKDQVDMVTKYQLRNAKGHFIQCDRDVIPQPFKARKAKVKGVVAKPAIIEPVAPVKPLPEPVADKKDVRQELALKAIGRCEENRCNYSLEFNDGYIKHYAPDVCHARLNWGAHQKVGRELVNVALNISPYFTDKGYQDVKNYPLFVLYVDYIINHSPWAKYFLTKDVEEAMTKGLLMDVKANVSCIAGAAMALRNASEFQEILKPFKECLDLGYSKDVSFLVAGHMCNGRLSQWPSHSVLTSSLPLSGIVKFFKEGYTGDLPPMYNDQTKYRYRIFDTICPGTGYGGYDKSQGITLQEFTDKHSVKKMEGEGFDARTVFDYKATLVALAEAFTKELK